MPRTKKSKKEWQNCIIGITGANGELGKALTKKFRQKGAYVIGLTHKKNVETITASSEGPQEWVSWSCGKESLLNKTLKKIDLLILNHGINPYGMQNIEKIDDALEINALSTWRLIKQFENIALTEKNIDPKKKLWINTSEAEVQPALSPGYEISKRLIGELVSLWWNNLGSKKSQFIEVKKLILGPFKSKLNPIGIMNSDFVADQILLQSKLNLKLIIVTPNPITYLSMPIIEIIRSIYSRITKLI